MAFWKKEQRRGECVMMMVVQEKKKTKGKGGKKRRGEEGVPCRMKWLEGDERQGKRNGREKGKKKQEGKGKGKEDMVAAAKEEDGGREAVMDVSKAQGFVAARVGARVPNDHSVRLGFPSPPANPFWRFRLFLDRLYVPAMGSEDARTLRCSALELARKSRLAKATPQYRRWLEFKAKGFKDFLCIDQVQTPSDFEDIFLEKDEHAQEVARRRRDVRRGPDGRSTLETAVA